VYDLKFSLGDDHPPTSVALREEHQRTILYHQCSHEVNITNHLFIHLQKQDKFQRTHHHEQTFLQDSTLASIRLRPWPAALSTARFGHVDDGAKSSVNAVRRVYIKTTNDHMVKPEQQEAMIRRWPPSEVVAIDTDHSPFFSAPERLFELILRSL